MTSEKPSSSITLRNPSDEPILVHAELMRWKAPESYSPSRDVLVNPAIFTIKARSSQIVRLGINSASRASAIAPQERGKEQGADIERAYRLFLQEVPPPPAQGSSILRTALRFGVPVFIPPKRAERRVEWVVRKLARKKIRLQGINLGNAHIRIRSIEARVGGDRLRGPQGRQYLLPGELKHWVFDGSAALEKRGGVIDISAKTDEGELHAALKIPAS